MNIFQIKDISGNQIQLSWKCGKETRVYQPIAFADPLDREARKNLQWYFEEYQSFPYNAQRRRANRIVDDMARWGEAMFDQIFQREETPKTYYGDALEKGLQNCEISIVSEDPAFLSIPWELLRDPAPARGSLAFSLAGISRQLPDEKETSSRVDDSVMPIRVLLVTARPSGQRDNPPPIMACNLFEALHPMQGQVELDILRPPTFDALAERLNERRGVYHLVHFDGYCMNTPVFGAGSGEGDLVFEKQDGTKELISGKAMGIALSEGEVPLIILSAYPWAVEGNMEPVYSIAWQLMTQGVKGVVALPYPLNKEAATELMERFYNELVEQGSLGDAVTSSRGKLFTRSERRSVSGLIDIQDWMIPVLFQREGGYLLFPRGSTMSIASEAEKEERPQRPTEEVCPEGRFGFIGREHDIHLIERAFRDDNRPWTLLIGEEGMGKTELAFGFARWYSETGGCPGGVFAASFREKTGFSQVLASVKGSEADFSSHPDQEQFQLLVDYLRTNACLMVWDGYETVAGYTDGAEARTTEAERDRLAGFLKSLEGGKSRVLITTCRPNEDWMGIAYNRVEVGGLTGPDAVQMAESILRTAELNPEDFTEDPEYARLIDMVRGHTRSLEIILPHLRFRPPSSIMQQLLYSLQIKIKNLQEAVLDFACAQLSDRAQRHLPLIGLFTSYVHEGIIGLLTGADSEQRPACMEILREPLDAEQWKTSLEEYSRSGLLRSIGSRIYALHPSLIQFLRRQLTITIGNEALKRLDSEFMRFYSTWAGYYLEDIRRDDKNALVAVTVEEANLLRALYLTEADGEWATAQDIVRTLGEFYEVRGRTEEWKGLRAHLLDVVTRGISGEADHELVDLWIYLLGNEARPAMEQNRLAEVENGYKSVCDYMVSWGDKSFEPKIAVAEHQLGRIAEEQQDYDRAEDRYRKALEIFQRFNLERHAADTCHQLGKTAQKRSSFDEAEDWYLKALKIYQKEGLERHVGTVYHQLSRVAEERQEYDQAESLCRQALELFQRLDLQRETATAYHQLGFIAQKRSNFDEAEDWYGKSLEVYQRLGLEKDKAILCHQMGRITEERRKFDEAEQWYEKSLKIRERLGLEQGAASDYHQLGMIAKDRKQYGRAEKCYLKSLEISERLEHPFPSVSTLAQLGVLHREQGRHGEALSRLGKALSIAAENEMPLSVQVAVDLARVMKDMGEKAFTDQWREVFKDQEPLLEALQDVFKKLEEEGF